MSLNGNTMGTTYSIKVAGKNSKSFNYDDLTIQNKIDSLLVDINLKMSTYIDSSEISKFNSLQDTTWFSISPDLAIVFKEALKVGLETDGSFDITVGPLVNLWGFGPPASKEDLPSDSDIKKALSETGYQNLRLSVDPPAIKKLLPDIYCDLSAIAKGYGVDKVANLLEYLGFSNYLVEIGGEVRTSGTNQDGEKWRVGILSPEMNGGIYKVLHLSEQSMATSGDYFNFFEVNHVKYSHTIDPRTGKPVTHNLASVTVLHSSCMVADAYATALSVLGPERGFQFATKMNLSALFIVRDNGIFVEKKTAFFDKINN